MYDIKKIQSTIKELASGQRPMREEMKSLSKEGTSASRSKACQLQYTLFMNKLELTQLYNFLNECRNKPLCHILKRENKINSSKYMASLNRNAYLLEGGSK